MNSNRVVRYVLVHLDRGIFLGHTVALPVWSRVDPMGFDTAATYPTGDEALLPLKWLLREPADDDSLYRVGSVEVELYQIDETGAARATREQCVAAGLPDWDPGEQE